MTDTIATVSPYIIPPDPDTGQWWARKAYILVRVETQDGVVGWGESHVMDGRELAIAALIRQVGSVCVGQPAQNIRGFCARAFGDIGQQRPGLDLYSAFAGIELALWDIQGKTLGVPVHQLFGGTAHTDFPVYANIYSRHPRSPREVGDLAADLAAQGYRAIKLYPFKPGTPRETGIATLQAVADAVGPGVRLAVDLWRQFSPADALAIARAMEPFDLMWLEDPFAPTDAASMGYLRQSIPQPLLTGETLPTRREFLPLFEARSVDLINPDICLSGIVELQAITAMAEPYHAVVSVHNSNSMAVGATTGLHALAGFSNVGPLEYFPLFETALDDVCTGRQPVVGGRIGLSDAPGFGLQFDDGAMQRFAV